LWTERVDVEKLRLKIWGNKQEAIEEFQSKPQNENQSININSRLPKKTRKNNTPGKKWENNDSSRK